MSAVRGLFLASPQRLDQVRELAAVDDPRFESVTVRQFTLESGFDACPPGAAFTASIAACPDAFIDIAFLDPLLRKGQQERVARCLAPGAKVRGGDLKAPAAPPDLASWVSVRGEYVQRLVTRGAKADSWLASTAVLDDLVLEAIDAHADRLFGQRRRRTLDFPGFARPTGPAWGALTPPPAADAAAVKPEATSLWRRLFPRPAFRDRLPAPAVSASTATALARTLSEGVGLGRQINAELPAAGGCVRVNIIAANDASVLAMGIADGLGSRDALVRVVDRSSARLGAFMLLYRELRFSCRRRVVYRWCPAPEPIPPAHVTIAMVDKSWEHTFAMKGTENVASEFNANQTNPA